MHVNSDFEYDDKIVCFGLFINFLLFLTSFSKLYLSSALVFKLNSFKKLNYLIAT